jgi:hypothetical protein
MKKMNLSRTGRAPVKFSTVFAGLFFLLASVKAQTPLESARLLDLFKATENGQTLIMLTKRDSVLYPLLESRPEMTQLYGRFWENERFLPVRDLNVDLVPDGSNRAGVVILLEMKHKVGLKDPGFEMHRRFGQMMVAYCRNVAGARTPVIWKVAVDTTYGDESVRRSSVSTAFGSRYKSIYQEPAERDSAAIELINEKGGGTLTIPAIEMAQMLASGLTGTFEAMYSPLLSFDGFKYGMDGTVGFQRNPIDQNSLLILFKLGKRVVKTDPELNMHRNLAEKMVAKLNERMKPFAPAWLDFKAAADTTGGKSPYVLLVAYTR